MADHHSVPRYHPFEDLRRRLLRNRPAMLGLGIIVFAILIAIAGYGIMPDDTPNANDGAAQLQKLPPFTKATFLKLRKNQDIEERNFFQKIIYGQENLYLIKPITAYEIEGDFIKVNEVGKTVQQQYELLPAVKALFIGDSPKRAELNGENVAVRGDDFHYLAPDESVQVIDRQRLIEEFEASNIENRLFVLGTDSAGRDMLSRLLYGTRISLSIGFVSVIISMFIGIALGAIAGFFGGKTDAIIVWFMSVVWSIPGIMLVIAISLALQSRGLWVAFLAVGLTMWVEVSRVVRGQIISIRQKQYIEAARAFGIGNFRIIMQHIMPNIAGPLIVIATANFAAAILLEAGLSFLGLSVQAPTPSWGIMIEEGYQAVASPNSWHLILFPALAICTLVLSFNLLGNGLRDAIDPGTTLSKKWRKYGV